VTERALDAAVLDTLRQLNQEGQPDIVREVLTLFLDDAPRRLAAIRDALERRDAAALLREAHTLKGAAAHIGAVTFERHCRQLEAMGRAASLDGASEVVQQIEMEFGRVSAEIRGLL
jgi:HPt (histidine-containing phosphotransfer) domain-containing protein